MENVVLKAVAFVFIIALGSAWYATWPYPLSDTCWRIRKAETKAFFMLNSSGYNVGCFMLPYVQNVLGPLGVIVACMFDTGNSIMCTGGTYALARNAAGMEKGSAMRSLLKAVFTSVPFDVYLILILLAVTTLVSVMHFTG